MTDRAPKRLPPPTADERAAAAEAARVLRAVIADHALLGAPRVFHLDYSRPRRAEWVTTWAGVPGFARVNGSYRHDCLPGWYYTRAEIKAELIPDLEALAEHGVRPTEVTNRGLR